MEPPMEPSMQFDKLWDMCMNRANRVVDVIMVMNVKICGKTPPMNVKCAQGEKSLLEA
jgi:hypothetical protein